MRLNNRRCLLLNGGFWSVYNALTVGFISVFALALEASNVTIGILGAVPFVSAILSQIPGAKITEYFKRKTIYFSLTLLSRLIWILVLLAPFIFKSNPLLFVIVFFFLIQFLEFAADPAWTSLAGDIVPDKVRGRYFGKRQVIKSLLWMIAILFGGVYLDMFPKGNFIGFASMFFAGALFGLAATFAISKIKEKDTLDHNHHHNLKEFFAMPNALKRFCIAQFFFNFAYMIASPFFTVYMLKNLGMSYTFYVVAFSLTILTRVLAERHIGKLSDKYGDKPLAVISMLGTALVPLIFIFITKENLWLIVPAQMLSGFVWGGTELTLFNLLLDLTDRKERPFQVAEFTLLTSIPLFIAPILGGIIADNAEFLLTGIPLVFAVSCILRGASPFLLAGIKEPRGKRAYPIGTVFKEVITFHPTKGAQHFVRVIVKRIRKNELQKDAAKAED